VVAEGVESQEQLNFLRVLGNDEYQGFLHSKPLPAREIEPILLAHMETGELAL
jgi:EAL domain-containing protein (putative c-di-GMP-specific phosphodiesterase class I)